MKRNSLKRFYLELTTLERFRLVKAAIERGDAREAIRLYASGPCGESKTVRPKTVQECDEMLKAMLARLKAKHGPTIPHVDEIPNQTACLDAQASNPTPKSSEIHSDAITTAATETNNEKPSEVKGTRTWPRLPRLEDYLNVSAFDEEPIDSETADRILREMLEKLKAKHAARLISTPGTSNSMPPLA